MVTRVNTVPPTFFGNADDTKPTDNVENGSSFIEMNDGAGKLYLFDEENQTWTAWES